MGLRRIGVDVQRRFGDKVFFEQALNEIVGTEHRAIEIDAFEEGYTIGLCLRGATVRGLLEQRRFSGSVRRVQRQRFV
jgi:hypothetical protein